MAAGESASRADSPFEGNLEPLLLLSASIVRGGFGIENRSTRPPSRKRIAATVRNPLCSKAAVAAEEDKKFSAIQKDGPEEPQPETCG